MSKKKSSLAGLQALYARACGSDVHKKLVVACVRILDSKDGTVQSTLRKFGTMTADLLELRQWLAELKVTHVAMESTGVYWQPVSTCSKAISGCGWSTHSTSSSFSDWSLEQSSVWRLGKVSDIKLLNFVSFAMTSVIQLASNCRKTYSRIPPCR